MPTLNEKDTQLHHTVYQHLLVEAFVGLVTALDEALLLKDADERFGEMAFRLKPLLDQLDALMNDMIDTIPDLPSREEAEKESAEVFKKLAMSQGLSEDTYLGKERLH